MYSITKDDMAFGSTKTITSRREDYRDAYDLFNRYKNEAKVATEDGSKHTYIVTLLEGDKVIERAIFEPIIEQETNIL